MAKTHQILVFGKAGCDKCKVLNQRIDNLLTKEDWKDFEKVYCDVETEDGLIAFCNSECINPQRIPAFVVRRHNEESGSFDLLPNPTMGKNDKVCGDSKLYTYLGLQTDYTDVGRGIISPKMIAAVLQQALSC
jgi:hypothetical protein